MSCSFGSGSGERLLSLRQLCLQALDLLERLLPFRDFGLQPLDRLARDGDLGCGGGEHVLLPGQLGRSVARLRLWSR